MTYISNFKEDFQPVNMYYFLIDYIQNNNTNKPRIQGKNWEKSRAYLRNTNRQLKQRNLTQSDKV